MLGNVDALYLALTQLAQPTTILLLVAGIVLGLAIGVLPGLGPPIAISIALPFTFHLDPVSSRVLLLAIRSAAIYGGSISAIAVGIPGTGATIATVQVGYVCFGAPHFPMDMPGHWKNLYDPNEIELPHGVPNPELQRRVNGRSSIMNTAEMRRSWKRARPSFGGFPPESRRRRRRSGSFSPSITGWSRTSTSTSGVS